jgi:hypothetical protein
MKPYSRVRLAVRTAIWVAAALALPFAFGAEANGAQAQAQLLDHAVFPCANCFFGASDHYYCFAADNKVLIGHRRTPVLNWKDNSKNYLAKVHGGWADWNAAGLSVSLRYDDKHIWLPRPQDKESGRGVWAGMKAAAAWITRAKGKQVKLERSSPRDIFTSNEQCRGTDRAKAPGL